MYFFSQSQDCVLNINTYSYINKSINFDYFWKFLLILSHVKTNLRVVCSVTDASGVKVRASLYLLLLSLDKDEQNCMLQTFGLRNKSLLLSYDYIFVQLFLFVFSTKNMMRSRFITHYFLAQGKGNNVCCKRATTVIFRTVVLNCKFQSISYFLHYL